MSSPSTQDVVNDSNHLEYSHWSKDIIFVISDGYLDGMQAFLNEYHGSFQSSASSVTVPQALVNNVAQTYKQNH